jgi:threonine/homoserine/homoserine lactone efflux protein
MIPGIEMFLKGIIMGLAVSMPLGPIGIILVNRTIKRGIFSGFFSGLGIATADTIMSIIAAIGFSFIISFIMEERFIVSIVAGVIMIAIGGKVFLSNPVKDLRNKEKANKSLWRDYYSVLALSLSNPYSIFIFVAFFTGMNFTTSMKSEMVPFFFVPGVFIGAISWWICLSYFVSRFKSKIRLRGIVRINKVAGIVIVIIGIVVLLSLFTTIK